MQMSAVSLWAIGEPKRLSRRVKAKMLTFDLIDDFNWSVTSYIVHYIISK